MVEDKIETTRVGEIPDSKGQEEKAYKTSSVESNSVEETRKNDSFDDEADEADERLRGTIKSFGIRKNELIAGQLSSMPMRITLYVCLFILTYIYTLDTRITSVFTGYATNSFNEHSLLSTMNVISAVMAAGSLPFYARMSDLYGRIELLVVSILFALFGNLIRSQAYDIHKYAAGTLIEAFGGAGLKVMLRLVMADNSTMNWRLFAITIVTWPQIINTWVGGVIVTAINERFSWHFGLGMFSFLYPISSIPLFCCLIYIRVKAVKTTEWQQLVAEEKASRHQLNNANEPCVQRLPSASGFEKVMLKTRMFCNWVYYGVKELFWKSDFMGLLIFVLICGLILVPLTLAGGTSSKWATAQTIVPLVLGFVLIPFFALWEMKVATHPVAPFPLLKDRGVYSAILIGLFYEFVFAMPHDYLYTVLLVAMNAGSTLATQVGSLNSFMIAIIGPITGIVVSKVRRTKAFILAGICVWFFSTGLLYHFRGDNDGVNWAYYLHGVIAASVVFGFGSGLYARTIDVSIQSCTDHEYMAAITGVYMASFKVGSALGDSVSGAMWTQLMYPTIESKMRQLGVDTSLASFAFDSPYDFIAEYTWGSLPRQAVVWAYADIQKKLCIVGLCLCVPLLASGFLLRDHRLPSKQSIDSESDNASTLRGPVDMGRYVVQVNNRDDDKIIKFFKSTYNRVTGRT